MSAIASPEQAPVASGRQPSFAVLLVAFAAFTAICLGVYRSALSGPFISDDVWMVQTNPYVTSPDANLPDVLHPAGDASFLLGGNYAPLPIAAHALVWGVFGPDTRAHHVVNVSIHALNTTLLVALLCAARVPTSIGLVAGAMFAVHPANVEAVAWISQLRTLLSLCFALLALLCLQRRPLASAPLFALALLSKASAAFAWPMAGLWYWARHRQGAAAPREGLGFALWTGILLAYVPAQLTIFASVSESGDPYPDVGTMLRGITSLGARYLAMATTGYGTSAYHEPRPPDSYLDPWFLAGLAAGAFVLWRIGRALRRGDPEAAWWIAALAAFAPISQIFPFMFGMADRWLYFILPGLMGGTLLASRDLVSLLARGSEMGGWRRRALRVLAGVAAIAAGLLILRFGQHAMGRAGLWVHPDRLHLDAAQQYPDGLIAHYVRALDAVRRRNADEAIFHLRESYERSGTITLYLNEPRFGPLHAHPAFVAFAREGIEDLIVRIRGRGQLTQMNLRDLAIAQHALGNLDQAIAALDEALRMGGPFQSQLAALRWEWQRERRAAEGG